MLYDRTLTSVRLIVVNRISRKVSRETGDTFGMVIAMNVIVVRKSFFRSYPLRRNATKHDLSKEDIVDR